MKKQVCKGENKGGKGLKRRFCFSQQQEEVVVRIRKEKVVRDSNSLGTLTSAPGKRQQNTYDFVERQESRIICHWGKVAKTLDTAIIFWIPSVS